MASCAMGPDDIVVILMLIQSGLKFLDVIEDLSVEQLVSEFVEKAFYSAVLPW